MSAWAVSAPAAFVAPGGKPFSWPSAMCYFFGRNLYRGLGGKVRRGLPMHTKRPWVSRENFLKKVLAAI